MGFRLIPGFAIGGMLSYAQAIGPSFNDTSGNGNSGSASNSITVTLGTIGPYVDWYPSPTGGFHVLGTVALAYLSASDGTTTANSGAGIGLGLGVGYDFWITKDWSIGALGRFTYARTGLSVASTDASGNAATTSVTDSMIVPAILFSVSYH